MAKSKSNNISIANVLAVIGVVALGVLTYLGRAFISGGEMGISILWAVGVMAIATALLVIMIKAKGVETNFGMWRVFEISALVLYLGFAVLTAKTAVHFFVINDNKDKIKECALHDVEALKKLNSNYLEAFNMAKNAGEAVDNAIKGTESYWDNNIQSLVDGWEAKIDNWSLFHITGMAKEISSCYEDFYGELEKYKNGVGIEWDRYINGDLIDLNPQPMQFGEMLKSISGTSVLGLVVLVILHLMILLNYVLAYRSPTTKVGSVSNAKDSGMRL